MLSAKAADEITVLGTWNIEDHKYYYIVTRNGRTIPGGVIEVDRCLCFGSCTASGL